MLETLFINIEDYKKNYGETVETLVTDKIPLVRIVLAKSLHKIIITNKFYNSDMKNCLEILR